jgi:cysteinyl-tRNA synthetase
MLKLFNTLSRKKEAFKPLKAGQVGMYTCGPTVYDYAHIGNFRAYVCSDILKRFLKFENYKVKHVMNLTDVDDKTIRKSQAEKITLKQLTEKYSTEFFKDLKTLGIEPADIFPRATEHIKEMIVLINTLIKKGYAYLSNDGSIYYDISKFKDYGKLSHFKIKKLRKGASERIKQDSYEKEQAQDFALWKAYSKEDGDVFWNAEFDINGKKRAVKGRPGWHLECSVMSMKYLGESFDIHSGGIDLVFPHHENEIAQSEAATGKQFVKYWLHNGWLLVFGKKMSKSLGNFFTLRDILNKGYSTRALRLELMATHYRQEFDFNFNSLNASVERIKRIDNFLDRLAQVGEEKGTDSIEKLTTDFKDRITKAMDDDLNVPRALEELFTFIREANIMIDKKDISKTQAKSVVQFLKQIDTIFNIIPEKKEEETPKEVQSLVKEREKVRKERKFARADEIRQKLKNLGYIVEDSPEGPRIRKI